MATSGSNNQAQIQSLIASKEENIRRRNELLVEQERLTTAKNQLSAVLDANQTLGMNMRLKHETVSVFEFSGTNRTEKQSMVGDIANEVNTQMASHGSRLASLGMRITTVSNQITSLNATINSQQLQINNLVNSE